MGWGLRYGAGTKLGIVPKVFSTFLLHPKLYQARDYSVSGAEKRLIAARDTMGRKAWRQYAGVILDEAAFENLSSEMLIAWSEFSLAQRRIRKRQKQRRRRFLSPSAWSEYWILAQKLNVLRAAQHRGWKWIDRSIRGSARSITPASLQ